MSEKAILPDEMILNKIYFIREQKVMIDRDLAALYGVETKRLKEQVRRNMERFPESYIFEMSEKEFSDWRSHFATSNEDKQGLRHAPFCFTEHGILQLSNILKSQQAIKVSFIIIDVFVRLRKSLTEHTELWLAVEKIRNKLESQDKSMEVIFRYLDELSERVPTISDPGLRKRIGYKPDDG